MTLACVMLALILSVSSCDLFRKMVGRPTSKDIAELKVRIDAEQREASAKKEAELQAVRDSVEAFRRDSLAMAEAVSRREFVVAGTDLISGSAKQALPGRYLTVIGAFREDANAGKLAAAAQAKGHEVVIIRYCNGCMAVALDPEDELIDAYRAFQRAKEDGVCPKDAWVMDTNQ